MKRIESPNKKNKEGMMNKPRVMRVISIISACCLYVVILSGCAHQKLLERNTAGSPAWTLTPPEASESEVFFVGRSLAVNVLDERHAINQAMDDAAYQIAKGICAGITGKVEIVDSRRGEAIRGKEKTDQPSNETVVVDIKNLISGMVQKSTYYERWSVREKFMHPKYKRYKYWVLVSFPSNEFNRLKEEVKKKLKMN